MAKNIGKVSQIIGPVVDVEFSGENNRNKVPSMRVLTPSRSEIGQDRMILQLSIEYVSEIKTKPFEEDSIQF